MQEQVQIISYRHIPIFQVNGIVKRGEIEAIKTDIKQQIKDGVVVTDRKVSFLGYVLQPL